MQGSRVENFAYDPIGLMAENRRNGRPLLENAKIYRGSIRPDQNHSTLKGNKAYATLLPSTAVEFARNGKSINGAEVRHGFIGQYPLDRSARFYADNGLQQAQSGKTEKSASVGDIEKCLEPLVDKYIAAQTDRERRVAAGQIELAIKREFYETAIPTINRDGSPARPERLDIIDNVKLKLCGQLTPDAIRQSAEAVTNIKAARLAEIAAGNVYSEVAARVVMKSPESFPKAMAAEESRREAAAKFFSADTSSVEAVIRRSSLFERIRTPQERGLEDRFPQSEKERVRADLAYFDFAAKMARERDGIAPGQRTDQAASKYLEGLVRFDRAASLAASRDRDHSTGPAREAAARTMDREMVRERTALPM
ncbi:MAG: hypothetical protein KJZ90_00600 [Rhodocyclaceae bacterium]|nr:hypothetical protein [Rhodocyclaceae bacterium]